MSGAALQLSIVLPALLAGLLVTATHAPLGRRVLERGIVFIDLAVAQIAGLGVVLADWLAERAKIPSIAIAFTVGGTPQAKDLFTLYDDTLERLLAAAK